MNTSGHFAGMTGRSKMRPKPKTKAGKAAKAVKSKKPKGNR